VRYFPVVFLFCLGPAVAGAGERLTPRPLDPIAAETFARAVSRSAMVRSLVATLEQSNVVVHIVSSLPMPTGIGGTTRFVAARGGHRYVRITIGADLPNAARIATLGHELQHACEIAASQADDVEGLRQMFTREGSREGNFFETSMAIEVERRVRLEITAGHGTRVRPWRSIQGK
jgi:hypothetical protein